MTFNIGFHLQTHQRAFSVVQLINSCPNLTSFPVKQFSYAFSKTFQLINPKLMQQLTHLYFAISTAVNRYVLDHLLVNCKSLQHVTLPYGVTDSISYENLLNNCCKNLLEIECHEKYWRLLSLHSRTLKFIRLFHYIDFPVADNITAETIVTMVNSWPNLIDLQCLQHLDWERKKERIQMV